MPLKTVVIGLLLIGSTMRAESEVTADPAVRRVMWQMLADTRWGFSHSEKAAFIVRTSTGQLVCLMWYGSEENAARWRGSFPRGTVAIAHTHPNWLPAPSTIDAQTAERTKTPVYVVTRSRISRTAGGSTEVVLSGDWKP